MNLPLLFASPGFAILFKWTCLLALGWVAHWVLRRRHARWRLILWRGILCFGLALPLLHFFQIPGLKIPVAGDAASTTEFAGSLSPAYRHQSNPARIISGAASSHTGRDRPGIQQRKFSQTSNPIKVSLMGRHSHA